MKVKHRRLIHGTAQDRHLATVITVIDDEGATFDGHGQDKAVVVIGVVADEIDPPWCCRAVARGTIESLLEALGRL